MHRQSLGSPASKLHHGHGAARNDAASASLSSNDHCHLVTDIIDDDDDDDHKAAKPRRFSTSPSSSPMSFPVSSAKPERLIHLIPLLTFFCFLVLYLVSHNPTPSDLAHFDGLFFPFFSFFVEFFVCLLLRVDSAAEVSDASVMAELRRGDFLAIRSVRNLQEIAGEARAAPMKPRSHRKFAGI
ncbi:hypothetical protein Tsubulata_042713 [Turnera subulata]|uniref:Uncharacterized protein n=1 Tax=Turnera subulata TaxID=218843 RepID=A0A9Q0FX18_9ROSI|nr:hypothetical protein Tsubulata_042713 [Turnera subulata]